MTIDVDGSRRVHDVDGAIQLVGRHRPAHDHVAPPVGFGIVVSSIVVIPEQAVEETGNLAFPVFFVITGAPGGACHEVPLPLWIEFRAESPRS